MYRVKRDGGNGYHIFDASIDIDEAADARVAEEIHRVIDNEELVLFYQPKVEAGRGVAYGAEALLRWQHPEDGIVPPGKFLPTWESCGAMAHLDRWVLRAAMSQVDAWRADGIDIVLSVNVSAWLLGRSEFREHHGDVVQCVSTRARVY